MAKVKIVDWFQDRHGDFCGTISGHGMIVNFFAEHSGDSDQEIFFGTDDNKLVVGAIRKRVLDDFEAAVNKLIDDTYKEYAEIEEEICKERQAEADICKKWRAQHLNLATITPEMRQYVVEHAKKDGYDVTMENFDDAIVSNSPRGAFARSYLCQIDDRPGIYSMRTRCIDADTTTLVSAIINEPETTVV